MARNFGVPPRERSSDHFQRVPGYIIIVFAVVTVILAFGIARCSAHMHDRPDLNDWFSELHSQGGSPCCDYTEGVAVDDPDWRTTELDKCTPSEIHDPKEAVFHYCVRLDGKWWAVPDRAVVTAPNRYHKAVVWPIWQGDADDPHGKVWFRCFMPGAGA